MNAWAHYEEIPAWGSDEKVSASRWGADKPRRRQEITVHPAEMLEGDEILEEWEHATLILRTLPDPDYFPIYDEQRVRGYTYRPYQQGTEWAEAANEAMKADAQANFMKRR